MGMNPKDVELLIEGEPYVGNVPVEPGFTNSVLSGEQSGVQDGENVAISNGNRSNFLREITGMNNEDRVRKEGVLFYDVIFFVRTADGLSKVIVNLEAQKSEPNQHYNDIKKVYSIWICMNEPENTLEKIYLAKEDLIGHSRWKEMYEIINVVIVRLGREIDPEKNHELHRLLGALFLPEMPLEAKNGILEEEFHIEMEGDRKELMSNMCNLSQGIKEQGIKMGTEQGIQLGEKRAKQETAYSLARRGMSVEDIADIVSVSTQTVQEWLSGADLEK